jgi:ATP-dependent DNA helicase RecQ
MAQVLPKTLDEFGKLSGVGNHKLSQYGDRFLAEIQAYGQEMGLFTQTITASPQNKPPSDTELTTLKMYEEGLSISEISSKRNIRSTTIIGHLADLIEKNQSINLNQLVPPERQQKIWQVLEVLGDINLTPIREYLGESYSFDEIRLVRGRWRREKHLN